MFCTSRHNFQTLRETVADIIGYSCPIYGGGAAGIITNQKFGYGGYQVGLACIWMDNCECDVIVEGGLVESEVATGIRLGNKMAELGTLTDSQGILFYDAIDQTGVPGRLLMATWILQGIKDRLGFLPNLVGAGLQGDHNSTPAKQFLGSEIGEHSTLLLNFSKNIRIDYSIMHGCRPATPYYTVTKAEDSTILEIEYEPALSFLDNLLGPILTPDDYPFFLIFGINHGNNPNEYLEENYANRLCFAIDKKRNGIVMFEPDMVEGTRFQIMARSFNLDYMQPKIEKLFTEVEAQKREIVLAVYLDCAGRCAGYGGMDIEDACMVQKVINDRVPLLGLYTGVEIAPVRGEPRGLDWTGVFCLLSKEKCDSTFTVANKVHRGTKQDRRIIPKPTRDNLNIDIDKLCIKNLAKLLELDKQLIAIRHELERKRRGFSFLSELSMILGKAENLENVFQITVMRINASLNMEKTIVLFCEENAEYRISFFHGYDAEEKSRLSDIRFSQSGDLAMLEKQMIVTAEDSDNFLKDFRSKIMLNYFISVPIVIDEKVVAILISGRMVEAQPFLARLDRSDMETLQAIAGLLASIIIHRRLDVVHRESQTDGLTGLLNRDACEKKIKEMLRRDRNFEIVPALILIDLDHFKSINDNYGHMAGDQTLKVVSQMLRDRFRKEDVIGRFGGDEFIVFYNTADIILDDLEKRVMQLLLALNKTQIPAKNSSKFHVSASAGISTYLSCNISYEELFYSADVALYESKRKGGNCCTLFK